MSSCVKKFGLMFGKRKLKSKSAIRAREKAIRARIHYFIRLCARIHLESFIENAERNRLMKNKKPKYSIFSNIWYVLKITAEHKKRLLICSLLIIPFTIATTLLTNYLTAEAVRLVTECSVTADYMAYVKYILCLGFVIVAVRIIYTVLSVTTEQDGINFRFRFGQSLAVKVLTLDYEYLENPEGQNQIARANEGLESDRAPVQATMGNIVTFLTGVVGLITYSAIVFTLSPWLMVLLFVLALANALIERYYERYTYNLRKEWIVPNRKLGYLDNVGKNFAYAKDIRIYNMQSWFDVLFHKSLGERKVVHTRQENALVYTGLMRALFDFIRHGVAYGVLIWKIVEGNMSVADFVWYFSVITQYADYLYKMANSSSLMYQQSLYFSDVRDLFQVAGHSLEPGSSTVPTETVSIEFRNVSFRYPNAEQYTLQNINFKIEKGQKFALVGRNGAGKTTLVKLLCGLYTNYEGEILLDGKNIREFCKDEYFSLLSVVFQDIALLPVSLEKNITLEEETSDRSELARAVQLSGLSEKIATLPDGMDTPLIKSVEDKAVDFSGGEMQKLALARALYKGGKVLLLDEPTAALDPIAENEMYQTYRKLTMGNTSIFISHRLSSTGFCDQILLLDGGVIKEQGTHAELLKQGGLYAEMFEAQSKYYKEKAGA